MSHAESIASELRNALRGDAWHGPALLEILEGVSAEEAVQRAIPAGHSIWELVLHITSWAEIVRRRITGGHPAPGDGEDWPETGEPTDARWKAAVDALTASHEQLCDTVAGLSNDALDADAPGSDKSVAWMLHGTAQHDAYHGGQIVMLKKLVTTKQRRAAL